MNVYEFHLSIESSDVSNRVRGFEVQDFWRMRVGSNFDFSRRTWIRNGSKFGFSEFGPGFSLFQAE